MHFKHLERKPEREISKRIISASVGLDHYKWYQSHTTDNMPAKRLNPERGGLAGRERVPTKGGGL